jgi:hypothetical protein
MTTKFYLIIIFPYKRYPQSEGRPNNFGWKPLEMCKSNNIHCQL